MGASPSSCRIRSACSAACRCPGRRPGAARTRPGCSSSATPGPGSAELQRGGQAMSITRHDSNNILSLAVQHGDTVYLAGVVAKNVDADVKGQTKEILA